MQKNKSVLKEIPLAEITLRRYERPVNLNERDLIRKTCLSLGLLQPGDSRDVIVDILNVLVKARKNSKQYTSREICSLVAQERENNGLSMLGIAPSNIRRQLRRLKELHIVEKRLNAYRIIEHEQLEKVFEERLEKVFLPAILSRVREYLKKVDEL